MPIYEYRCASCGFQKEYLQRMSDAPLTDCPECKQATLNKMVTAAGFQLKGGGWYVTDFKGGNKGAAGDSKKTDKNQSDTSAKSESGKSEGGADSKSSAKTETKAAATSPTPPASSTSS